MSFLNQVLEWVSDKFTRFITVITGDHRYIHEGKGFTVVDDTGSIAAAGSYSFAITTPAKENGYIHFRPSKYAASANITLLTITRGATVTGGSAVTPINKNHNSNKKSNVTVLKGVTVSVAGTSVYTDCTGSAGGPGARAGGSGGADNEMVLKPSTTYSITFSNIGTVTASTSYLELFWYEEGAGE